MYIITYIIYNDKLYVYITYYINDIWYILYFYEVRLIWRMDENAVLRGGSF